MSCSKCGLEQTAHAVFCRRCGTGLDRGQEITGVEASPVPTLAAPAGRGSFRSKLLLIAGALLAGLVAVALATDLFDLRAEDPATTETASFPEFQRMSAFCAEMLSFYSVYETCEPQSAEDYGEMRTAFFPRTCCKRRPPSRTRTPRASSSFKSRNLPEATELTIRDEVADERSGGKEVA